MGREKLSQKVSPSPPRGSALGGLKEERPILGAEQQVLHLLMRDGVQLGRAVEVEGRAEGDPDKKHEPRLDADGGGRTGQGEHGEAGDGGQATDDRHRLAPASGMSGKLATYLYAVMQVNR